jgi:hypothetical protein
VEQCKKEWQTIRKQYSRIKSENEKRMRSGAGASKAVRWALYEDMAFMKDTLDNNPFVFISLLS